MNGLIDYVEWVSKTVGIKLEENDLYNLTIDLINNDKHNEVLKELQDKIVEVSDSRYFNEVKRTNYYN